MMITNQAIIFFAVFIASGISFFPGRAPRIFSRITVGIVGIVSCLLIAGGIIFAIGFAAGFGARGFGQDGVRMMGAALIGIYFALCSLTSLPVVPVRYLRSWGLLLHFIYMPLAIALFALSPSSPSISMKLSGYANELSWGLAYAMLWFRMLDRLPAGDTLAS